MVQTPQYQFSIRGPGISTVWIVELKAGTMTIGRLKENDVWLKHAHVSRRHAQLIYTPDGWRITDLDSTHGTHVNGELVWDEPHPLAHNDVVHIGPFELIFEQVAASSPEVSGRAPEPPPTTGAEPGGPAGVPPSEPPAPTEPAPAEEWPVPPGLSATESCYLMHYLPPIYDPGATHSDFLGRFLALFESILMPIKWTADNFDLYLDPGTAPEGFLAWLAGWFDIVFDPTWSEAGRRTLLKEAHQIYARRGTRWSLSRVLEIYTGRRPEIIDDEHQEAHTFTVKLPLPERDVNVALVAAIIEANKPAHTRYKLECRPQ